MRQLAWLHAVPEGSKKSRQATFRESSDDDAFLQFPDIDGAEYLVSLLQEAGLAMSNGMGPAPLTWQEIEAWHTATERQLTVWEKLTLREMSEVYVGGLNEFKPPFAPQPYVEIVEPDLIDRPAVASKLLNVLRGFKRKKPGE